VSTFPRGVVRLRVTIDHGQSIRPERAQIIDSATRAFVQRLTLFPDGLRAYESPPVGLRAGSYILVAFYTGTDSCVPNREYPLAALNVE